MNKREREAAAVIIGNWLIQLDGMDKETVEYKESSARLSAYKEKVMKILKLKWELCLVSDYCKDVMQVYQDIIASAVNHWMTVKSES